MSVSNIETLHKPDSEQMLRHVRHLFEDGDLDGCHDGLIELAWTDGNDKRLRHAELFGTDELEELVDRAIKINQIPNQNVYIGQALRKPSTPRHGRCTDDDFFALTALYADVDDDIFEKVKSVYSSAKCKPTAVVVTGRTPFLRAQTLWRLNVPERDPETCREINRGIAAALQADTTVANPGRVMRLGGSMAWPIKGGERVLERTEFHTFNDGRPRSYYIEQLARAFPPPRKSTEDTIRLNIGTEFDGVSVDACLNAARSGVNWHNHTLRLIGHWIGRGWSNDEILATADSLTLPGYTVDQTHAEMRVMIDGARVKWGAPNPEYTVDEPQQAPTDLQPLGVTRQRRVPPRQWLLGNALCRDYMTVLAATGGSGKTSLAIAWALSLASGQSLVGEHVHKQTRSLILTLEDSRDELDRRLQAACIHYDLPDTCNDMLLTNTLNGTEFTLAHQDMKGNVKATQTAQIIKKWIVEHDIGAVFFDPYIKLSGVNENDNRATDFVCRILAGIAETHHVAVALTHHTRKGSDGADDMQASRGAGALIDAARIGLRISPMSREDAEAFGVSENERARYVSLNDGKANLQLKERARWYRLASVNIGNGDENYPNGDNIQVVEEWSPPDEWCDVTDALWNKILDEIDAGVDGNRYSSAPNARDLAAWKVVQQHLDRTEKQCRHIVNTWVRNGVLVVREYFSYAARKDMKGLYVVEEKRPGVAK